MDIPVSHVFPRRDARKIDPSAVKTLVASIAEIGIINPLRVRPAKRIVDGMATDAYEVTAGGHRLQAALKLGLATVPCIVVADDDIRAELAMIDENLCRLDLSPAERASQTARRKELYLELHPETAVGENQHSRVRQLVEPSERFTKATANVIGLSERAVQRDAARGEKIAPDVLDKVKGTHLDTGTYLDTIKKLPVEEQRERVDRSLTIEANQRAKERQRALDIKARAAKEIADAIARYVPETEWHAFVANLETIGAGSVAHILTALINTQRRGAA